MCNRIGAGAPDHRMLFSLYRVWRTITQPHNEPSHIQHFHLRSQTNNNLRPFSTQFAHISNHFLEFPALPFLVSTL